MAVGSKQPLKEMNTRDISWGGGGGGAAGAWGGNPSQIPVSIFLKSGNLEISGLVE
jgi:hypothetical protein